MLLQGFFRLTCIADWQIRKSRHSDVWATDVGSRRRIKNCETSCFRRMSLEHQLIKHNGRTIPETKGKKRRELRCEKFSSWCHQTFPRFCTRLCRNLSPHESCLTTTTYHGYFTDTVLSQAAQALSPTVDCVFVPFVILKLKLKIPYSGSPALFTKRLWYGRSSGM